MKTFHLIACCLLAGPACDASLVIDVMIDTPPRGAGLSKPLKLYLLEFGGQDGAFVTSRLREAILESHMHTLVDPSADALRAGQLERMLASGEGVGVEGPAWAAVIVRGSVSNPAFAQNTRAERSTNCVAHDRKGRCSRTVPVVTYTRTERCAQDVLVQAMRTVDGALLLEKRVHGEADRESQVQDNWSQSAGREVCQQALERSIQAMTLLFVPGKERARLRFHEVAGAGPATSAAVAEVRAGHLEAARQRFTAIADTGGLDSGADVAARYNLALAHWAIGDREACLGQLDVIGTRAVGDKDVASLRERCAP